MDLGDLGIARIMTFFFAKPCAQHCQILADRCEITPAGLSMGLKLSPLSMGSKLEFSKLSPVVKLQCGDDAEVKTCPGFPRPHRDRRLSND